VPAKNKCRFLLPRLRDQNDSVEGAGLWDKCRFLVYAQDKLFGPQKARTSARQLTGRDDKGFIDLPSLIPKSVFHKYLDPHELRASFPKATESQDGRIIETPSG